MQAISLLNINNQIVPRENDSSYIMHGFPSFLNTNNYVTLGKIRSLIHACLYCVHVQYYVHNHSVSVDL